MKYLEYSTKNAINKIGMCRSQLIKKKLKTNKKSQHLWNEENITSTKSTNGTQMRRRNNESLIFLIVIVYSVVCKFLKNIFFLYIYFIKVLSFNFKTI